MGQLHPQRERIQDDLRGLIAGEVRCDDLFLQLYASDGSIHEIKPSAVVRPRSTADVAACVQYAAAKRLPVHARGAGTRLAGQSLGPGLVVDFSRFLRRVIWSQGETVRVQPGLVHRQLNGYLRQQGRFFAPDPSAGSVTTVGGMIAVDAAGSRWLKYGSTGRYVRSLQVVLADGHPIEAGREPLAITDGAGLSSTDQNPRKREVVNRLVRLLTDKADLLRRCQPKCLLNGCGYRLTDVLGENHLDLAQLLVGSEGTLALITEATLATQPLARHRGVALLMFDSLEKASRAVLEMRAFALTACDLMDRRHVSLAREAEVRFDLLIPPETEALLLIEQEEDESVAVRDGMHRLIDALWHQQHLAFGARQAFDPEEMELFWQLAAGARPFYPVKGPSRPVPVVEDVVVPPELLPNFLVRMQNVLKRHQVTASLFSHAGQGQIHIQPFLDLADPGDVERMRRLAEELYQEVLDAGGTISGEHACGLSRTPFVRRQAGDLYDVLREVKQIFDPAGTLNPGKIIGDDPDLMTRYLRPPIPLRTIAGGSVVGGDSGRRRGLSSQASATGVASYSPDSPTSSQGNSGTPGTAPDDAPPLRDLVELQLNWDPARVSAAAADCNRCGECRTQARDLRMCPLFRFSPAEESSPRAKANLIIGLLTGRLELGSLTNDEFKAIADLCVHCHMCRLECPARVDVPRLMREGKGAYVTANGLRWTDWVLTHLDLLGALGSVISPAANWALGNRQMRWLMEKTLGIAQGRKLPRVSSRSFLRHAARRRLTRPARHSGRKVVYFVDTYANYHDPQLAAALVSVMEHNGVSVYVPPKQRPAGMASVACGALEHARRLAERNLAVLADAVRQGYHVVATEPSAALCLVREYPQLIDDDDARLVAAHSSEACTYLWQMHVTGKLQLDLRPINAAVGYHLPCHLKALEVGSPGENLLRLIPGLRVHRIEEGCSGMAGTFGMKRANYRTSLRAGWRLISRLRDPDLQAGVTECSTCKMQMEQGTTKPTCHPVKLLALAYGLMPELAGLLTTPGQELIVT